LDRLNIIIDFYKSIIYDKKSLEKLSVFT